MLLKWIKTIAQDNPAVGPIAPNTPFVAIGDIHGRCDLLEKALRTSPPQPTICVGDYVDRGDHSADVLRLLHERPDIICLMGNHEEMMLNFIDNPKRHGPRWLRYGGLQTLASFGVAGLSDTSSGPILDETAEALKIAMGEPLIAWVRNLPTRWQSGNVAVVHAGADPSVAIEDQARSTLLWGHPEFHKTRRTDDTWVVHGHTIVDAPSSENGIISIDTGAYATGRLTVAHVSSDGVTFSDA